MGLQKQKPVIHIHHIEKLDIFDWLKASPLRKNVARIKNFITLPTSNSIIGFYFLNNEKCIFFSSNSSNCAGHLLLQ